MTNRTRQAATHAKGWGRLQALLREEWRHLTTIQTSDRAWQIPFFAALATGLPLLAGAYFNRTDYGLVASLGGLVFIYMPGTPLAHRMATMMACAFGMTACYTLGIVSQLSPLAMMPALVFTTILVTMACRFFGFGPPGSLFFVMAASIGAYSPVPLSQLPLMAGLLAMGCLQACLLGFFYSVWISRHQAPKPVPRLGAPDFGYVILDSVVIGIFVGIALALAQVLQMPKAYWVPVSCLAVIQGTSLRAVWNRQLHRVIGTAIGLLLSWGLLSLSLDRWSIALTMMALTVVIEFMVTRHYAAAAIFITPLTILLADAAMLGYYSPAALLQARLFDTVLGCLVGLAGGVCLHDRHFREVADRVLRRLIPARLQ